MSNVESMRDEVNRLTRENELLWQKFVSCRKALASMEGALHTYRMAYREVSHECSTLSQAARELTAGGNGDGE